jgi:hypothetical protein
MFKQRLLMVETIVLTTDFPSTVERLGVAKFASSTATHLNCTQEACRNVIVNQNGDNKPYPPEFYTPYLSVLSQTWRRSPSK